MSIAIYVWKVQVQLSSVLLQTLECLEICVNYVTKCVTAKISPPWSPNLPIKFLSDFYKPLRSFYHKYETISSKQFFLNFFFWFSNLSFKCLKICVNRITICEIPKFGWQSDIPGTITLMYVFKEFLDRSKQLFHP